MGKGPKVDCSKDVVLTQQSSKDDADINVIVARAKRGAELPVNERVPHYGDFSEIPTDLRDALNQLNFAKSLFMTLDPQIRFRFNNDPVEMLDFLADPGNKDEAIELGLVEPPSTKPAVVSETPTPETKAPGTTGA